MRAMARSDSYPRGESSMTICPSLERTLAVEHHAATWKWRGPRWRMHTVAHQGFAANMRDDEGVVRICGGMGDAQDFGRAAPRGCAEAGRDGGASGLWAAAET